MVDEEVLLGAFWAGMGREVGDRAQLGALLARKLDEAVCARPTVTLAPARFARALGERVGDGEPLAALEQLRAGDVYLATAAQLDAPGALAAFDESILTRVPIYLARIGTSPGAIDEVKQALRVKLFVGSDGGEPRITQYSGRGALDSWVCAAAIRAARDLHRADARRRNDGGDDLDVLAASDDPELEVLRHRYQAEFRAALQEALTRLTPRQRTMLRLHFFEKLTTIELGRLYAVNQSTTSRWLAEARATVFDGVRAQLRERLGVSATEFDSLVGLMHSRLEVSFSRLLAGTSEEPSAKG